MTAETGGQRRAQDHLDSRAIELATEAKSVSEKAIDMIGKHVDFCAKLQRTQLVGIIILLVGMVGTLVNLYVLPHAR